MILIANVREELSRAFVAFNRNIKNWIIFPFTQSSRLQTTHTSTITFVAMTAITHCELSTVVANTTAFFKASIFEYVSEGIKDVETFIVKKQPY
jgi:hypothetical protein